ncbi:Tensin 1 [Cichlidogyrus casuarinus]|uniref:Tensin 1 n=1 Tax=Cichlidogyrus casuarinus TaxID=1844966 RepID=A0ABD2QKH3_9PLAT
MIPICQGSSCGMHRTVSLPSLYHENDQIIARPALPCKRVYYCEPVNGDPEELEDGVWTYRRQLWKSSQDPKNWIYSTDVLYLGNFDVDRLEGDGAVRKAVTDLFALNGRLPKRCRASVRVSPNEGVFITDVSKTTYMKKSLRGNSILWVGFDPEYRDYATDEMREKRIPEAKIFGIVCKRHRLLLHENTVHLMCELSPGQGQSLVQFLRNSFTV